MALSIITVTVFFLAPLVIADICTALPTTDLESTVDYKQYMCETGFFNPLATILLNSEGSTIRAFLDPNTEYVVLHVIVFFVLWYLFTIITSGTAVPAGIFLPGILIGCAIGHLYG